MSRRLGSHSRPLAAEAVAEQAPQRTPHHAVAEVVRAVVAQHVLDVLGPGDQVRPEQAQIEADHAPGGPRTDGGERAQRIADQSGNGVPQPDDGAAARRRPVITAVALLPQDAARVLDCCRQTWRGVPRVE